MSRLKDMLIFLLVIVLGFYGLPLMIQDTGTGMLFLLVIIPLVCFASSLLYGILKPFSLLFPLAVALLFIPTIFIYYNESAWVYSVGYGAVALLGGLSGRSLSSQRSQT